MIKYTDEDIKDYVINCMSSDEVWDIFSRYVDIESLWDIVEEKLLENTTIRNELEEEIIYWKKRHGFEDYSEVDFKKEMWEYET